MYMPILNKKPVDVEKWTTRDFVGYYMHYYRKLIGDETYTFPQFTWLQYGVHIKRFKNKLQITNSEYRDFIDYLFSPKFIKPDRLVGFMAIVSGSVFHYYQRHMMLTKSDIKNPPTLTEIAQFYKQLIESEIMFPKREVKKEKIYDTASRL